MNYKEIQRQKAERLRDVLFGDPGGGIYKKIPRECVLSKSELNVWPGIREDVLAYYFDNSIVWWDSGDKPSGHLLSSQIDCLIKSRYLSSRNKIALILG